MTGKLTGFRLSRFFVVNKLFIYFSVGFKLKSLFITLSIMNYLRTQIVTVMDNCCSSCPISCISIATAL